MTHRQKNVLMLVNSYAPDDPRVIFTAQSLTQMGYNVYLIGAARQRDEWVDVHHRIEGVRVYITPMVIRPSLRAIVQLIRGEHGDKTRSLPHIRTSIFSMLFFNLWILRISFGKAFSVIHCHDLSPLPAAWLLSKLKRTSLIYDVHEDAATLYEGRRGRFVARMERWLLPGVDVVISAGVRLQGALYERGAKEVVLIGNWKRLDDYEIEAGKMAAERERLGINDDDFVVTYIGTLDPSREIVALLEAVSASSDVKLIIGGRGILQPEVEEYAGQSDNIIWLGWVNLTDVPLYTHMADVIYHVRARDQFVEKNYIAPAANKVFEAFAAGKPLMATRGINEVGDIIEETDAGVLLDDITPESIAATFDDLRDQARREALSQNALKARESHNWSVAEERLAEIYGRLLK